MVTSRLFKDEVPVPLYPVCGAEELSCLESLILREAISRYGGWLSTFVLGVRLSPRVTRGDNGRILSFFEVLSSTDNNFLEDFLGHLYRDLVAASHRYTLSDEIEWGDVPHTMPEYLELSYQCIYFAFREIEKRRGMAEKKFHRQRGLGSFFSPSLGFY